MRGEEVAHLAELLGEEISRTSKLVGKDTAGLLKLLREKIQINAKVGFEEDQPGEFSATDDDVSGEKVSGMSGRRFTGKVSKRP